MMADDLHKPSLYKWKRQESSSRSRVYSRSQNCKTDYDIQDWMKKVEQASDRATEAVLGSSHVSGRGRGTKQQLNEHDQVVTEAQELLDNWMQEKRYMEAGGDDDEADDGDGPWVQSDIQSKVKREWDHLIGSSVDNWRSEVTPRSRSTILDRDPYSDEDDAVETILNNMLHKPLIREDFLQDLGLTDEPRREDPRLKMELRHKQVKENREKRERGLERQRRQQQDKKDSLHKAKQIVLKEERQRELRVRREEEDIKQQMTVIRKHMQEDQRHQQEQRERAVQERAACDLEAQEMLRRQMEAEQRRQTEQLQAEEVLRRRQMDRLQQFHIRAAGRDIKCLHRHFSAWYHVVLERRIHMGKARALSDWKLVLRSWNAWRSYTRSHRLNIETQRYEQSVIDMHRKRQRAEQHHRRTLMHRYLAAWQMFVYAEQDRRHLVSEQSTTRSKMMSLLDAAATGKLWQRGEEEDERGRAHTERRGRGAERGGKSTGRGKEQDMVVEELDDFFGQPNRAQTPTKQKVPLSSKSNSSLTRPASSRIPTQAWQVTRKHVNLMAEEMAAMGGGDFENNSHRINSSSSSSRLSNRPGKQPYVVNNFENRYTTQQKLLHVQQKAIREQKRMIEDLQFFQKQQQHQEVVARQQLIQLHLNQGLSPLAETADAPVQLNNAVDVGRSQAQAAAVQAQTRGLGMSQLSDRNREIPETARTDSSSNSTSTGTTSQTTGRTNKSNTKYLQALTKMEERTLERKRIKHEREEKKRREEEERLAVLEAHEVELKRQMEEDKKVKAIAHREKKRLEKEREATRLRLTAKQREQTEQAEAHYTRALMLYHGLVPLRRLVAMATECRHTAETHHSNVLCRKVLLAWSNHTSEVLREKYSLADEMGSFLIIKKCFTRWKMYKHHLVIEMEKAKRFHEKKILHKIIQKWADFASDEKFTFWDNERIAKEHYLRSLTKMMFQAWRRLPQEARMLAEREKRRNELRKKVADLLPDYEASVLASSEIL